MVGEAGSDHADYEEGDDGHTVVISGVNLSFELHLVPVVVLNIALAAVCGFEVFVIKDSTPVLVAIVPQTAVTTIVYVVLRIPDTPSIRPSSASTTVFVGKEVGCVVVSTGPGVAPVPVAAITTGISVPVIGVRAESASNEATITRAAGVGCSEALMIVESAVSWVVVIPFTAIAPAIGHLCVIVTGIVL